MKKKYINRIFLYLSLCFITIFLLFIYIGQPDCGGSKKCYQLTGIDVDHYKGSFVPEFSFPSIVPIFSRYKFHLKRADFSVLKYDLENQYGCVWRKNGVGLYLSFPGMEIEKPSDIITYFKRGDNLIIWLCYNPQEEYLYIGLFFH